MAKKERQDTLSCLQLADQFVVLDAKSARAKEVRDQRLDALRTRLLAGESTGDVIRDFVLLDQGQNERMYDALVSLDQRTRSLDGELVLLVSYRARSHRDLPTEAVWSIGLLDGSGLLFRKPEQSARVPVDIGVRAVTDGRTFVRSEGDLRCEFLMARNVDSFLERLQSGLLAQVPDKSDLTECTLIILGNADVVSFFQGSTIPYSIFSSGARPSLARALTVMGVSPSHVPEMHAWLVKEQDKLETELSYALTRAREALQECLRGALKELQKKPEDTTSSEFSSSDRIGGGGPLPPSIQTSLNVLTRFRERCQDLRHRFAAMEGLEVANGPVAMATKRFIEECAL